MAKRTKIASKMYGTTFYKKWASMKTRCFNSNEKRYKDWGGRGITVCEKWLDFDGFYDDMYSTYKEGLSLDRIDNNGDYEPSNCRWVELSEQNNNTRASKWITINGKTQTLTSWIRELGLKPSTVRQRYYVYGQAIERALEIGGVS